MIRVLHVLGGLGSGGTESLIMNWYRNIDRERIQFDFLVRSNDTNYVQEIEALGGRVFYTSSFPRHLIRNRRETEAILSRKEWEVIHVHATAAMYMLPLRLAKKMGYRCRIMHSHSIQARNPLFSLIHFLNRQKIDAYATQKLACSEAAGRWLYGSEDFTVIKNAVDTGRYLFSESARKACRKELVIEDKFVVGHVGRFAVPKNHDFLLDVFYEIKKLHNNSVLMLVGDGELESKIRAKAAHMGILDSVLFMGRRDDVGKLMSAMDVFLLPSLFEGMPVVCVECCANELTALISEEAYTKEIGELPNVHVHSLRETAQEWATRALEMRKCAQTRGGVNFVSKVGYDISTVVQMLTALYKE